MSYSSLKPFYNKNASVYASGEFSQSERHTGAFFYCPNSPRTPPLGTITKLQSTPENKGLQEIAQRRSQRYALQNQAKDLLPNERVCNCLRHRITQDKPIGVKYNHKREKAHYDNLQRCGSVWTCPVCAIQISEGRRQELKQGIDKHRANGGAVYLMTLTNRHHFGDNLDQLLAGQRKALNYLWGNRKSKEMFKSLGLVGRITATEVTHGDNGWHPHYHILLFFNNPINEKALQGFVATYWQHCCEKAGLQIPTIKHGCLIHDGSYADQYVSKWGLESEMTKGHIKKGREGGLTPFDLLKASSAGCDRSGRLFQQFASAFKGKKQLSWTKGLKALLLVEEKTDEQLATETDKDSESVKQLAVEIWKLIRRYKSRAEYLRCVELDMKDGGTRADDLVMFIAGKYTKDYMHELIKDNDLNSLRSEVLEYAQRI